MKHIFNISPALFKLIPVMQENPVHPGPLVGSRTGAGRLPQTYWGDCLFDENHTLLTLRVDRDVKLDELLDGKMSALQPVQFTGRRYSITYIPVLN